MIDFRDLIYNRDKYVADGQRITRVRLEVVTEDGHVFYVHKGDHGCQQARISSRSDIQEGP